MELFYLLMTGLVCFESCSRRKVTANNSLPVLRCWIDLKGTVGTFICLEVRGHVCSSIDIECRLHTVVGVPCIVARGPRKDAGHWRKWCKQVMEGPGHDHIVISIDLKVDDYGGQTSAWKQSWDMRKIILISQKYFLSIEKNDAVLCWWICNFQSATLLAKGLPHRVYKLQLECKRE